MSYLLTRETLSKHDKFLSPRNGKNKQFDRLSDVAREAVHRKLKQKSPHTRQLSSKSLQPWTDVILFFIF